MPGSYFRLSGSTWIKKLSRSAPTISVLHPTPFGLTAQEIFCLGERLRFKPAYISSLFDLLIDNGHLVTHIARRPHATEPIEVLTRVFEPDGEMVSELVRVDTTQRGLPRGFERLARSRVYRAVQADVGKQLEQVFRALCYLLARWRSFGERAAEGSDAGAQHGRSDDKGQLNLIEFDKFCNVVCRIWTVLFQRTGLVQLNQINKLTPEELQGVVRFKPPFEEIPTFFMARARRGRRLTHGKSTSSRCCVPSKMRVSDTFRFQQPTGKDDAAGSWSDDPSSVTIAPSLLVADEVAFLDGFTRSELDFLKVLASGLCHLSPDEVRALGTHRDGPSTVAEIERELRWTRRKAQELIQALEAGTVDSAGALRLCMFINEGKRKATENQEAYKTAFAKLSTELHDGAREGFLASHRPAAEVWGDSRVATLSATVETAVGPADCVFALSLWQESPELRRVQSSRRAQEALRRWGRPSCCAEELWHHPT